MLKLVDIVYKWDNIIKSCLTAGEEILGVRLKEKHYNDVILESLSNEQRVLKMK